MFWNEWCRSDMALNYGLKLEVITLYFEMDDKK